jgi:hypothetical protein
MASIGTKRAACLSILGHWEFQEQMYQSILKLLTGMESKGLE